VAWYTRRYTLSCPRACHASPCGKIISTTFRCACRFLERLGKFVTELGIALEYSQDIAPARGASAGGKITLLPGQSPAEEFATIAHELAHEMLHRDQRGAQTTKRVRETEAEAVSFVVCSGIGLDTGTAGRITSNFTRVMPSC
jgi:hypothetical protein